METRSKAVVCHTDQTYRIILSDKVSIIIPVFNTGKLLQETLASVEAQTHKNLEVVIVDNGSTDGDTISYLQDTVAQEHTVIVSEARSVSAARNLAIDRATGTYILPLDSDDIIHPEFVTKSLGAFTKEAVKVVRTQVKLFGKKKGVLTWEDFTLEKLLARNMMVVTSMFRKEDWKRIGGFDESFVKSFEDWEFWINLLRDGGEVATIQEPLFYYRIRKKSRNHQLNQETLAEGRYQVWNKHKELYARYFVDPRETFEYKFAVESTAHKIGNALVKPFKRFKLMP